MSLTHLLKNFQNFYNKNASADSTDNILDIVYISWYDVFEVFPGLDQLAPLKQSICKPGKGRAWIVVKFFLCQFQSIQISFCTPTPLTLVRMAHIFSLERLNTF